MAEPITDISQVTPDWLTGVLRKTRCLDQGRIIAFQQRSFISFSSTVANLELTLSGDAPRSAPKRLFLKLPKLEFEEGGKREVEFYRTIAPIMSSPFVIRCYDAVYYPALHRSYILLDDLSHSHSQQEKPVPVTKVFAEQMVECLANIHAYWWEHPRLGKGIGLLPTQESLKQFLICVSRYYCRFVDYLGDRLSVERRAIIERVLSSWPPSSLMRRVILGRRITLVHGDAYEQNFLFPDTPADGIYIFDWHAWQINIGTNDLANWLAKNWYPERRARMEHALIKRYHTRLLEQGVTSYSWEQCWHDYRTSVILNILWPINASALRMPANIWWPILEKVFLAYQDLDCEELLTA